MSHYEEASSLNVSYLANDLSGLKNLFEHGVDIRVVLLRVTFAKEEEQSMDSTKQPTSKGIKSGRVTAQSGRSSASKVSVDLFLHVVCVCVCVACMSTFQLTWQWLIGRCGSEPGNKAMLCVVSMMCLLIFVL